MFPYGIWAFSQGKYIALKGKCPSPRGTFMSMMLSCSKDARGSNNVPKGTNVFKFYMMITFAYEF
jgi:hypothetical protein